MRSVDGVEEDAAQPRETAPAMFHAVRCERETPGAILVTCAKRFDPPEVFEARRDPRTGRWVMWLPKKAVHDDSEVYGDGHEGKLVVEGWWLTRDTSKSKVFEKHKPLWMGAKLPRGAEVPVPLGLQYLPKKPPGRK